MSYKGVEITELNGKFYFPFEKVGVCMESDSLKGAHKFIDSMIRNGWV